MGWNPLIKLGLAVQRNGTTSYLVLKTVVTEYICGDDYDENEYR